MKKAFFAFPILMALSCQPTGQKNVLFFGDSITAVADEPGGYLVKLREMLAAKGLAGAFKVSCSGIPGNKIYDLYLRLEPDVLEKRPDIVVVFIGVNDVWHKQTLRTGTDLDKFEAFYAAIIKKLLAQNIKVILATPAAIGEKADGSNENDTELGVFVQTIHKLAARFDCPLADLRQAFLDHNRANNPQNLEKGILTTDGAHFNDAGGTLAAKTFFSTLNAERLTSH